MQWRTAKLLTKRIIAAWKENIQTLIKEQNKHALAVRKSLGTISIDILTDERIQLSII